MSTHCQHPGCRSQTYSWHHRKSREDKYCWKHREQALALAHDTGYFQEVPCTAQHEAAVGVASRDVLN